MNAKKTEESGETPKLGESRRCIGEEPDVGGSVTLADDAKMPDGAEPRKNRNTWLKRKYKLGTWNIRNMTAGKLNTIINEANENNRDILGITEHRWAQKGHFKTDCGGQIIYSGKEKAGQSGVAIFLSKTTSKSIIGYKPVNDRILTVRLFGQAKNITLIQVYAPTSPASEEEIEEFYDILQKEVDNKDKRDILIISGDFNAKVGGKINREEDGIVGITGLGERNERGTILVDFAVANEIAIKNTMFEKHPRRLFTWTSPDGKTKNQIDNIMIEKRWASAIQDVTTKPKADCDTDHELQVATLKIKLKIKKTTVKPIRYDVKDIGEEISLLKQETVSKLC
ncbi:endonuclease-reverse transcriptase [Plakobranchus ocellatus]|uniref:Endonuclease-reverse transcriptase n=1 Tax=Plakobranchus ocellatus TaxID=259542 RepID=A0AAV4C785_9GAST|nr:endonuclease-reverse transcriptase [Plakobranchus ocellatus]